ncbi:alpha/beta hydrolase [Shimia sp. SDUM112013]|uniref:alpha/beta hydrolase n=1 Tax=Shimia sp. SDUM112013 TaxID=3136160 RepID=UPI0032EDC8EF
MRMLIRVCLVLAALGLGTIALGNLAERWVIYPFDGTETSPGTLGLESITVERFALDGESLVVWTAPPAPGQPVIFYLHGNAGNLALRAGRFGRFLERGYGLLAMGYRGSSGSTGTPSEAALIADALAVYRDTRAPVVVYGESLGTAVAVAFVAALAGDRPAAVVLEAPFTSIPDLAEHHYPGTRDLAARLENTWRSLDRAGALTMPLLVLHGDADTLIPIEQGRQIFSAAPSSDKDMITVKGAGHTDLWRSDILPRLWRFVDQFALR